MKFLLALALFASISLSLKAETVTLTFTGHSTSSGYQLTTSTGEKLYGLCLDSILAPPNTPTELVKFSLSQLSGDPDYAKYLQAAILSNIWLSSNSEEKNLIQGAIWMLFNPNHIVAGAAKYLTAQGSYNPDQLFLFPVDPKASQRYVIPGSTEVPEPATILTILSGLSIFGLARKRKPRI